MSTGDRPSHAEPRVPSGTAGDGKDGYPTYHDQPGNPLRAAGGTKPTDTNLPRSRRSSSTPMLMGVLAFAAVVVVYILWSVFNMASTTDEAMTPGDAATPPAAGSAPTVTGTAVDSNEAPGQGEPGLDRNAQPQSGTAPPAPAGTAPGASDVPGGGTSGGSPPATSN